MRMPKIEVLGVNQSNNTLNKKARPASSRNKQELLATKYFTNAYLFKI